MITKYLSLLTIILAFLKNKLMNFNYIFAVILLATTLLNAQSATFSNDNRNVISASLSPDNLASRGDYRMQNAFTDLVNNLDKSFYVNEEDINGSKYFIDAFLLGKVYVNNKTTKDLFALKYNAYLDLIEVQKDNAIEALIKAVNISCSINGQLYVYHKYLTRKSNKGKLGYLKVLHKGKNLTLFKQESVKFKEAKPSKTSIQSSFPARFLQFENYFFLDNTKDIALPLTKKSLLNTFDNNLKIKSYIKEEKINFKNENNLIKLFSFYDSIINQVN
jgi:hypothetical protein